MIFFTGYLFVRVVAAIVDAVAPVHDVDADVVVAFEGLVGTKLAAYAPSNQ